MNSLAILTTCLAVCGICYFCVDSYRHRQRTASQLPSTDASESRGEIYDFLGPLDGNDLHAAEQTANQVGHAVGGVSHQVIAHAVEVVSHGLSHY